MNTNMNENKKEELNLNELEQVNGGILPLVLGFGTIAVGAGLLVAFWPRKK